MARLVFLLLLALWAGEMGAWLPARRPQLPTPWPITYHAHAPHLSYICATGNSLPHYCLAQAFLLVFDQHKYLLGRFQPE